MTKQTMQFLFGDRELLLNIGDLLSAATEVIVNPANCDLSHADGLAEQILQHAGDELQNESNQLIREHGQLESGMAVYTTAGRLPYKAVVHAVGPKMGEVDQQQMLELLVARSLKLCEINEWQSIAFPAISTSMFNVPLEICARAFYRAITSFWDARVETSPEKIILCLDQDSFRHFFDTFRGEALQPDNVETTGIQPSQNEDGEVKTGIVNLSEQDISELDEDDINDWFK